MTTVSPPRHLLRQSRETHSNSPSGNAGEPGRRHPGTPDKIEPAEQMLCGLSGFVGSSEDGPHRAARVVGVFQPDRRHTVGVRPWSPGASFPGTHRREPSQSCDSHRGLLVSGCLPPICLRRDGGRTRHTRVFRGGFLAFPRATEEAPVRDHRGLFSDSVVVVRRGPAPARAPWSLRRRALRADGRRIQPSPPQLRRPPAR